MVIMEPVLEMRGISKRFPGVQALTDVNIKLYPGEIHSLIGQNGAGKSTLMKILCGNYKPDTGTIILNGKEISIDNTSDAKKIGIGIVYQELSLLNNLTVAENVFLGRELTNGFQLDNKKMKVEAIRCLQNLGIQNIDIDQKVGVFPLAKKQLIEVAKIIYSKPSIIILDEPTAALAKDDTSRLFEMLFKLKENGIAIVFISHRLGEIKKYCDRGTILMNGKIMANIFLKDVNEEKIIEYMLGESYKMFNRKKKEKRNHSKPLFSVKNIRKKDILTDVSFDIYPGEITGFTGLLGAGQDTLWRIIYGAEQSDAGEIFIGEKKVKINNPAEAVKKGIGLLTENRKEEGIYNLLSVMDNMTIPSLGSYLISPFFPLLKMKKIKADSLNTAKSLNIIMRSLITPIKHLSGGNQQKVILARWLIKNLKFLIFIEPTRGVDVGAKAEIYKILEELAEKGKTIVIVSTDTAETLTISDRIIVMREGSVKMVFDQVPEDEELQRMVQGA
jgi:ribose transport system ATP-binding protein